MRRAEDQNLKEVAAWFRGATEKWEAVFDRGRCRSIWNKAYERAETHDIFVMLLRAGLLKQAREAAGKCVACSLHTNRLASRPVFDDGDVKNDWLAGTEGESPRPVPISTTSAKIMLVGESAGVFEQRTGVPFISYQSLAGASLCARECGGYEVCYNSQSKFPQGECVPAPLRRGYDLERILQIQTERAGAPLFPIQTVGSDLDRYLLKAGLWREVWNPRNRLREGSKPPQPGSVYVCNATKCRSCNAGGKDCPPTREEIEACLPWLAMQIYIVQPLVIVALGNTALGALTGMADPRVLALRGKLTGCEHGDMPVLAEVHPSYIARIEDKVKRAQIQQEFVQSLLRAKQIAAPPLHMEPAQAQRCGRKPAEPAEPGADYHAGPTMSELIAVCAKPLAVNEEPAPLNIRPSEASYIPTLPNGENFTTAAKEEAPAC